MNKHCLKDVSDVVTRNYLSEKDFQTFLRVDWYQYAFEKIIIEFHFNFVCIFRDHSIMAT